MLTKLKAKQFGISTQISWAFCCLIEISFIGRYFGHYDRTGKDELNASTSHDLTLQSLLPLLQFRSRSLRFGSKWEILYRLQRRKSSQ